MKGPNKWLGSQWLKELMMIPIPRLPWPSSCPPTPTSAGMRIPSSQQSRSCQGFRKILFMYQYVLKMWYIFANACIDSFRRIQLIMILVISCSMLRKWRHVPPLILLRFLAVIIVSPCLSILCNIYVWSTNIYENI